MIGSRALAAASLLILLGTACAAASMRSQYDDLAHSIAADPAPPPAVPAGEPSGDDEKALARETTLPLLLSLAAQRNPEVHEARERARAALERGRAAGRLPDLEARYQQWGVPLSRPYALDQAGTLMLGVQQTFPALGVLDARSKAGLEDARSQLDALRGRELDVRARVQRAFFDYYRADREYRVHLEHVELATHIVELARQNYQTGRATQQDVLRALVDLSRLHTDVSMIEARVRSSRAQLNALMSRPVDAPLGPPAEVSIPVAAISTNDAEKDLEHTRPELRGADRMILRSQAMLEEAKAAGRLPSIMAGVDYWYQPTSETRHAYAAMISINLPWLNGRHGEEIREAEHALAADVRARNAVLNTVRYEVRDAIARADAARQELDILDHDLLPQARNSFEAAQSAFAAGQGDALGLLDAARSFLQVRLERSRAIAQLGTSLADVERATGSSIAQPGKGNQ